jgi:ribosomal protein L37AE/L43A
MGWSLVQRSPTVCPIVCDQETLKRVAEGPSWTISTCEWYPSWHDTMFLKPVDDCVINVHITQLKSFYWRHKTMQLKMLRDLRDEVLPWPRGMHSGDLHYRWRWKISFLLRPLYRQDKAFNTQWLGIWVCHRCGLEVVSKQVQYLQPIKHQSSGRAAYA